MAPPGGLLDAHAARSVFTCIALASQCGHEGSCGLLHAGHLAWMGPPSGAVVEAQGPRLASSVGCVSVRGYQFCGTDGPLGLVSAPQHLFTVAMWGEGARTAGRLSIHGSSALSVALWGRCIALCGCARSLLQGLGHCIRGIAAPLTTTTHARVLSKHAQVLSRRAQVLSRQADDDNKATRRCVYITIGRYCLVR